jgi:large-conductance mechanosensitive channel
MSTLSSIKSAGVSFAADVSEFRQQVRGLTIAAFATIFTWGFVQALKRTVLTPVIEAYIIPSNTNESLVVKMRRKQTLRLGEFLAELLQWLIFMAMLFLIWKVTRTIKRDAEE